MSKEESLFLDLAETFGVNRQDIYRVAQKEQKKLIHHLVLSARTITEVYEGDTSPLSIHRDEILSSLLTSYSRFNTNRTINYRRTIRAGIRALQHLLLISMIERGKEPLEQTRSDRYVGNALSKPDNECIR